MAGNGIDLIRTWGFLNGVEDPSYAAVSIQPSVIPAVPRIFASPVQQSRAMTNVQYTEGLSLSVHTAFCCFSWVSAILPPVTDCTSHKHFVQVGVYNELSLQRLDLVLSEASANGVRIILPFVNFWADLGGMQWYVDQVWGNDRSSTHPSSCSCGLPCPYDGTEENFCRE